MFRLKDRDFDIMITLENLLLSCLYERLSKNEGLPYLNTTKSDTFEEEIPSEFIFYLYVEFDLQWRFDRIWKGWEFFNFYFSMGIGVLT